MEDIDISKIKKSKFLYRSAHLELEDLLRSIVQRGLLQPIVVRPIEDYFEIVAGNRRYEACKSLGWRKIYCHIVELNDKESFEVSLIENLQRENLDPVDEARAFQDYTLKLGWGGISELAAKIGKSVNYVDRRIRLLGLPSDVLSSLSTLQLNSSVAEELLCIKGEQHKSDFAKLAIEKQLSSRKVRELTNEYQSDSLYHLDDVFTFYSKINDVDEITQRAFDKSITIIKLAIRKLNMIIEDVEDNWIICETLRQHRNALNDQIDLLIKQKRKI